MEIEIAFKFLKMVGEREAKYRKRVTQVRKGIILQVINRSIYLLH